LWSVKANPVWQAMHRPLPVNSLKPLTSASVRASAWPAIQASKRVGGEMSVRS